MSFCVRLLYPGGKLIPVALSFGPDTKLVSVGPAIALRPGVLLFFTVKFFPRKTKTSGLDRTSGLRDPGTAYGHGQACPNTPGSLLAPSLDQ